MHVLVGGVAEEFRVDAAGGGELLRLGPPEEDEVDGSGRPPERRGEGGEDRNARDHPRDPFGRVRASGVGRKGLGLAAEQGARGAGEQRGEGRGGGDAPRKSGEREEGHRERKERGAGGRGEHDAAPEGETPEAAMREQGRSHRGQEDESREPGGAGHQRSRSQTLPSRVSKRSRPGAARGFGPTTTRYSASFQTSGARNVP